MKKPKIVKEKYSPVTRELQVAFDNGFNCFVDVDLVTKKSVKVEYAWYKAFQRARHYS